MQVSLRSALLCNVAALLVPLTSAATLAVPQVSGSCLSTCYDAEHSSIAWKAGPKKGARCRLKKCAACVECQPKVKAKAHSTSKKKKTREAVEDDLFKSVLQEAAEVPAEDKKYAPAKHAQAKHPQGKKIKGAQVLHKKSKGAVTKDTKHAPAKHAHMKKIQDAASLLKTSEGANMMKESERFQRHGPEDTKHAPAKHPKVKKIQDATSLLRKSEAALVMKEKIAAEKKEAKERKLAAKQKEADRRKAEEEFEKQIDQEILADDSVDTSPNLKATLADDKLNIEVDETLNTNYSKIERASEKLTQSPLKVDVKAADGVIQVMEEQLSKLKARTQKIKNDFNEEFDRETKQLQDQVENQHQNNTDLAEANKQISVEIEELQAKNKRIREKAINSRIETERLRSALDSLKMNLTTVEEYLTDSLDSLDDSEAPETEVLRELASKENEERKEAAWRRQLDELGLPAIGRHKVTAAMMQVDAKTSWFNQKSASDNGEAFANSLKALQDTVMTLQKEHGQRLVALRKLYAARLSEKMERYKALLNENEELEAKRRDLTRNHERLTGALKHLEATHSDLQNRFDALRHYMHHVSNITSKTFLSKSTS